MMDEASTSGVCTAAGAGRVEDAPPPHPLPLRDREPLGRALFRGILWNLYAIPATAIFVAASISMIPRMGWIAVLDLVISVPLYLVLHLHIWNKRLLVPWVWRGYAFGFVAWQLAFALFISPQVLDEPLGVGVLTGFVVQLPMLVAAFLYAFRTWPVGGQSAEVFAAVCPSCATEYAHDGSCPQCGRASRARRPGLVIIAVAVGLMLLLVVPLGVTAIIGAGGSVLSEVLLWNKVHEVGVPPPATPSRATSSVALSIEERESLRALFEAGEYETLNGRLGELQDAFEADATQDRRVCDAFQVFTRAGDGERLDEWVARFPLEYPPLLARAEHYYEAAWDARGTAWASGTSDEQFAEMRDTFAMSAADASAALAINPRLVDVYRMRIHACNAGGGSAAEVAAISDARELFPGSTVIAKAALHATLPRWGGSYEAMESLATEMAADNSGDARFVTLLGTVYKDQAELAGFRGDWQSAADLYSRALAYGEDGEWVAERGWARLYLRDSVRANADAERSIAVAPGYLRAYLLRASLAADRGDKERVRQDVESAEAIDIEDEYLAEWKAASDGKY